MRIKIEIYACFQRIDCTRIWGLWELLLGLQLFLDGLATTLDTEY